MQRLETNDRQRLQDDKQERAAGMMMMSADGDDQADQQHELADPSMAEPGHVTNAQSVNDHYVTTAERCMAQIFSNSTFDTLQLDYTPDWRRL